MSEKKQPKPFAIDPVATRQKLGINQTKFWSRVGVTQSGGSRYESSRKIPKPVQRLLVIANLSSSAVTPHLPEVERDYWRDERPILNNVVGEDRADAALSPWEAKVYAR